MTSCPNCGAEWLLDCPCRACGFYGMLDHRPVFTFVREPQLKDDAAAMAHALVQQLLSEMDTADLHKVH